MKNISAFPYWLLSTICALGFMTCAVSAQLPGSLTNGLVAYYTFNGTLNDSSGNGLHLDNFSAVNFVPSFMGSNQALNFETPASYAASSLNSGITNNDSRTVAFWIYLPSFQAFPTGNVVTLGPLSGTPSADGSVVALDDAKGGVIYFNNDYRDATSYPIPNLHLAPHFFAVSYENNLAGINMYVDGQSVPYQLWQDSTTTLNTLDGPINVGRSDGLGFVGQIQNLGIWNRSLSSNEVTDLYNTQSVPEPSTYALLLLGGAASLWALKRRKS
jgi:hypothetical protein